MVSPHCSVQSKGGHSKPWLNAWETFLLAELPKGRLTTVPRESVEPSGSNAPCNWELPDLSSVLWFRDYGSITP